MAFEAYIKIKEPVALAAVSAPTEEPQDIIPAEALDAAPSPPGLYLAVSRQEQRPQREELVLFRLLHTLERLQRVLI